MKSHTAPVATISCPHQEAFSHQPLQNSGNRAGVQVDNACDFLG
jgi:hypothetical protein